MSSQELFYELKSKIDALRRQEDLAACYSGALRFFALSAAAAVLAGLVEMFLANDALTRWIILLMASLIILAGCTAFLVIPILRSLQILKSYDDVALAKKVGARFPEIKDRLVNALQIYPGSSNYSDALIRAALETVRTSTQHLDFKLAVNYDIVKRTLRQFLSVLALTSVVFFFFQQPLTSSFGRLLHPNHIYTEPLTFAWKINPGNAEILQGQNVTVRVALQPLVTASVLPERISFFSRPLGVDNYKEEILKKDSSGNFSFEIKNIRQPVFYYAQAVDNLSPKRRTVRSDEFKLSVLKRPTVRRLEAEIHNPAYSGLGSRVQDENVGDVAALKGSKIRVKIEATKALKHARVIFSDSTEGAMTIGIFGKTKAETEFILTRSGSYHIRLRDDDGVESSNPVEYRLSVLTDEYPQLKLVEPEKDLDIDENMTTRLLADMQDDFGISRLVLHFRLEQTKGIQRLQDETADISFLLNPLQAGQTVSYNWIFSSLNLQPEDILSFYLEVFDNDAVGGPKSGKSEVRRMRFPSIEEIFAEANKEQDKNIAKAEDIVKQSEEVKKSLEEINKELLKDKKLDWKDKEKAKQLADKQDKMQKDIRQMKESLEQMTDKLNDNHMLSKETLDKYQELQKLMSEIDNKELQDLMKKLQEAMKNNFDQNQMKSALKNFKMDQESFQKNMERTVQLLKRIKAEQAFDQLQKWAEALKQRQDVVNEMAPKLQNENERSALTHEQSNLKQSVNQLQKKSEEQKELIHEIDDKLKTQMLDQAIDKMKSGTIQKEMDQSESALSRQREKDQSERENQKQISQNLDSLFHKIQKAKKEYQQQQKQQISEAMRKIIFDMLEISKDQEAIMLESRSLLFTSPRIVTVAERQSDALSDMQKVTENLIELSNKTFFVTSGIGKMVGKALANMDGAVRSLEERKPADAAAMQNTSMVQVNNAVKLLLKSMDKMNNPNSSGTGMEELMEELQKMAGRQGDLNEQTLQFGEGQGNQGQLSMEQQGQLARMMAEQQALKESMENMQSQAEGQQNLKGQLGNAAKEMEEVIKDMKNQNVNRKTLERQQKILQRLLDASTSMNEKEYSEKRKGEKGKDYFVRSPNELPRDLTERKNKMRRDLLKELQQGYSKDYQELIKKYFEALGNLDESKVDN